MSAQPCVGCDSEETAGLPLAPDEWPRCPTCAGRDAVAVEHGDRPPQGSPKAWNAWSVAVLNLVDWDINDNGNGVCQLKAVSP